MDTLIKYFKDKSYTRLRFPLWLEVLKASGSPPDTTAVFRGQEVAVSCSRLMEGLLPPAMAKAHGGDCYHQVLLTLFPGFNPLSLTGCGFEWSVLETPRVPEGGLTLTVELPPGSKMFPGLWRILGNQR